MVKKQNKGIKEKFLKFFLQILLQNPFYNTFYTKEKLLNIFSAHLFVTTAKSKIEFYLNLMLYKISPIIVYQRLKFLFCKDTLIHTKSFSKRKFFTFYLFLNLIRNILIIIEIFIKMQLELLITIHSK